MHADRTPRRSPRLGRRERERGYIVFCVHRRAGGEQDTQQIPRGQRKQLAFLSAWLLGSERSESAHFLWEDWYAVPLAGRTVEQITSILRYEGIVDGPYAVGARGKVNWQGQGAGEDTRYRKFVARQREAVKAAQLANPSPLPEALMPSLFRSGPGGFVWRFADVATSGVKGGFERDEPVPSSWLQAGRTLGEWLSLCQRWMGWEHTYWYASDRLADAFSACDAADKAGDDETVAREGAMGMYWADRLSLMEAWGRKD